MGNDMFNDEQLADAEVRAQASGIILSREAFLRRLHVLADTVAHNDSLLPSEVDLSAHDAALRAEVERLRERLDRIDAFAGERCEASGCRPDPCGPVEYHDVEGVPLCAECWQECLDEAAEEEGSDE